MKIIVLGAGVQGTVFAVRLARVGHEVILVSGRNRAIELRQCGSTIQYAQTGKTYTASPAVLESLSPELTAIFVLSPVRREQIDAVLPDLAQATAIPRIVFMVNHANGSAMGRLQQKHSKEFFEMFEREAWFISLSPGIAIKFAEKHLVDCPKEPLDPAATLGLPGVENTSRILRSDTDGFREHSARI
jgi:hypothetical protein